MTHDGFRTAIYGRRTAIPVLVVVGLLTSACTSSTSSASSSSSPVEATLQTANGAMVDINTGAITPLPASIATSGALYAVSPDHSTGLTVAYNACCTGADPVLMANLNGTQVHQISAPGWDGYGAQWSPDGYSLVYQQRHGSTDTLGNLFVYDTIGGQRAQLTNLDQTQSWGWWFTFPSFTPDGRSVLFQLPRGDPNNSRWDLWSVPVAGGKQTLVRRNAGWGGYSPDGKWLAYLSPVDAQSFAGGELWITSVHGGAPRALVRGGGLSWLRWSPDGTRIAYSDGGSPVYVVDVATGSTTKVAEGGNPEWFDSHTLILGNPEN
jgi:Tol biopolymer transport system component